MRKSVFRIVVLYSLFIHLLFMYPNHYLPFFFLFMPFLDLRLLRHFFSSLRSNIHTYYIYLSNIF